MRTVYLALPVARYNLRLQIFYRAD